MNTAKKIISLAFAAVLASAIAICLTPAYAQKHGGGGGGGGQGSSEAGHGGNGGKGGQGMGQGSGGQSLRDVFQGMDSGSSSEHSSATSDEHGSTKGGSATTTHGKRGSASTTTQGKPTTAGTKKGSTTAGKKGDKVTPSASEAEDSDRPAWAGTKGGKAGGNTASGTKKGDVYGDMYVILRNEDGSPQLKEITLADGTKIYVVQPVDANGVALPLDAEGNLVDATQAIAVDLGRLSVSRASASVLDSQLKTAVDSLNAADSITLDAAGRLVLTKDGVSSAIDSPLENLALYKQVLTTGTITGLTDATIAKLTSSTNPTLVALGTAGVATGDFSAAASFLGAASDKTIPLTVDAVVNINTILGINTKTDTTTTYYNYSTFSFNPSTVYGSATVDVLLKQTETLPDGTTRTVYVPTTANVYNTLFSTQTDTLNNIAAFTEAADDSRTIIQYVHDNSIATE